MGIPSWSTVCNNPWDSVLPNMVREPHHQEEHMQGSNETPRTGIKLLLTAPEQGIPSCQYAKQGTFAKCAKHQRGRSYTTTTALLSHPPELTSTSSLQDDGSQPETPPKFKHLPLLKYMSSLLLFEKGKNWGRVTKNYKNRHFWKIV